MDGIKTIAVMGATGKQGRGVVNALLFNKGGKSYEVRPMTRSTTSKLAQAFIRDYPELSLVEWQYNDTTSIQKCFDGCYGAFIISGSVKFPNSDPREVASAEKKVVERVLIAAEAAGVAHLVYPTFPSISNTTNGLVNINEFETKNEICRMIQSSSITSTLLCPGPFYTDLESSPYAYWEGEKIVLSTPADGNKTMGWADPGHDIGWFARAVFHKGPGWMSGREVPVCGEIISYSELANMITAVLGIKAEYKQCSVEDFVTRSESHRLIKEDMRGVGTWLAIAPDDKACYGTIEMDRLIVAEKELGIKALSWTEFLNRTRWQGPRR